MNKNQRFSWRLTILSVLVILLGNAFAETIQSRLEIASDKRNTVRFSGEHAGMTFEGKFETWQASLLLPPATEPAIEATFDVSSAKTGDKTYDTTLIEEDWFDAANYPNAHFVSEKIVSRGDGEQFDVNGKLTIKNTTENVTFVLKRTGKGQLEASFSIDRLAFGMGVESDPNAEWVSQYIQIDLLLMEGGS